MQQPELILEPSCRALHPDQIIDRGDADPVSPDVDIDGRGVQVLESGRSRGGGHHIQRACRSIEREGITEGEGSHIQSKRSVPWDPRATEPGPQLTEGCREQLEVLGIVCVALVEVLCDDGRSQQGSPNPPITTNRTPWIVKRSEGIEFRAPPTFRTDSRVLLIW
jgi:hypothetical protein